MTLNDIDHKILEAKQNGKAPKTWINFKCMGVCCRGPRFKLSQCQPTSLKIWESPMLQSKEIWNNKWREWPKPHYQLQTTNVDYTEQLKASMIHANVPKAHTSKMNTWMNFLVPPSNYGMSIRKRLNVIIILWKHFDTSQNERLNDCGVCLS
jgi:hypothetical protein